MNGLYQVFTIFLVLTSLSLRAQTIAEATDAIIEACRKNGGNMTSFETKSCQFKRCVYSNKASEVYLAGTNQKSNCTDDKIREELKEITRAIGPGSTDGANGGNSGGATGGKPGSDSTAGAAGGATGGANTSGVQSGSGSGSGSATGAIICEELVGSGQIFPGQPCYDECKAKRSGLFGMGKKQEGFERKSCIDCLLRNDHLYTVDKTKLPKGYSVNLGGGVGVRTGKIICRYVNGGSFEHNGTSCPHGSNPYNPTNGGVVFTGGINAGGNGGGGVIISGGQGGANGGINLPAMCSSPKSNKDREYCLQLMREQQRFACSSSGNPSRCMNGADADIMARYDINNCVNCQAGSRGKQSSLSGWAEIIGAAAPIAMTGLGAYFGYKSNQAWSGAAKAGFEQCRLDHNNYYQYLAANELPGLTPQQQQQMNCNGFGFGGFAGLGSAGLAGYLGAGYSPGFLGGMMGPYGGYNPYMMGGMIGGMAGGFVNGGFIAAGVASGISGGMGIPAGMAGGFVNGAYIASGMQGGLGVPAGMAGGFVNGGYLASGMQGGMGIPAGMAGGFVQGGYIASGMQGGWNGGWNGGGLAQGGYIASGMQGGWNGGWNGGGLAQGGYIASGMQGGGWSGWNGGFAQGGGLAQGGYIAAGMQGGGWTGGGWNGGGWNGGGWNGGGWNGGGFDYMASQQASNYDRMMQQQGMSFQMGMGNSSYYGGGVGAFGAAGYPMNMLR